MSKSALLYSPLLLVFAAHAAGEQLAFQYADGQAAVFSIEQMSGPLNDRLVVLKRTGPVIVSYTRYQFDCTRQTARLLGDGLESSDNEAGGDTYAMDIGETGLRYAMSLKVCTGTNGEVIQSATAAGG